MSVSLKKVEGEKNIEKINLQPLQDLIYFGAKIKTDQRDHSFCKYQLLSGILTCELKSRNNSFPEHVRKNPIFAFCTARESNNSTKHAIFKTIRSLVTLQANLKKELDNKLATQLKALKGDTNKMFRKERY